MPRKRREGETDVAKTTPIEFINQVQAETKKVVWPTRRETLMTLIEFALRGGEGTTEMLQ